VPTLFRRKSTAIVIEETDTDEAVVTERRTRSNTPSKREQGVATPRRGSANPRRPGAPEAARGPQTKATARQRRAEERSAMMAGEEWALLPRDRGAAKRLVRDIVDSRRNLGSLVFGVLIVIVVLSLASPALAQMADLVFLFLIVLVAIDSVLLTRRIKKAVTERLPKETPIWRRLYFYGILRSTSFRFMRAPRPQLKPGQKF
jgi:hypothetical protein